MAEGPRAQGRKGARPLGLRASDEDAPAPGQVLPQVGAMGGDGDAPPPQVLPHTGAALALSQVLKRRARRRIKGHTHCGHSDR